MNSQSSTALYNAKAMAYGTRHQPSEKRDYSDTASVLSTASTVTSIRALLPKFGSAKSSYNTNSTAEPRSKNTNVEVNEKAIRRESTAVYMAMR